MILNHWFIYGQLSIGQLSYILSICFIIRTSFLCVWVILDIDKQIFDTFVVNLKNNNFSSFNLNEKNKRVKRLKIWSLAEWKNLLFFDRYITVYYTHTLSISNWYLVKKNFFLSFLKVYVIHNIRLIRIYDS